MEIYPFLKGLLPSISMDPSGKFLKPRWSWTRTSYRSKSNRCRSQKLPWRDSGHGPQRWFCRWGQKLDTSVARLPLPSGLFCSWCACAAETCFHGSECLPWVLKTLFFEDYIQFLPRYSNSIRYPPPGFLKGFYPFHLWMKRLNSFLWFVMLSSQDFTHQCHGDFLKLRN